ncbi:hypothetical protein SARC_04098 [Sphaeroforma arctica JP610]|uniref:RRM domain-containing protein n=1 Tax=Sphaeroforma arctica JP610 TaxID=667725 RepID=A0A0L0G3P1_9EUKA|nr:hypothetical protein SARC_04098 [Sphaeroforma arctica JP610]KNC83665.1 hypothetical protein SARC_04098 [Sphaeroforma arctica JP610]|eukprot:XP_014157567.1 hypothetical protein SARC_04098 [Sphaeroforma arctica JP610]
MYDIEDFTKKHIEGAERSTGNTQSTTTRRNTRTNNENAGEKSTAINSTSKNRTAFPTDTPPPHVLSRIDSAHKRTRGGGSELSTDSDTYGVDTGPSARATKRKRLQATGSVAKDGEKVQETDTQSAWLRVSNIPKYCTLEQLKYCFRKADVSKPMFVSADRTNEGVGRVLIGPRFGGVSAALERYDGQELLGQTINVRLETQAETAEYSTDPKVTRASTRVRKTSTQTAQPTNNKLKTINQERKNTPSKARGRANIQDKDKIESRRGRANIQDKDKIESRTTKPSITTEANTPTRVEGKWGGATEQAAAKALIKAIWELIPLALKYIFILEYGVDLWQEVVYGKHMLQWTEKTTMRILSRQRQCLNEYWPKAVIDECIPKLIHVKESRVRTIPDENVIQLIRNVTLLCQYVTTRLPEDRAREIGKMRDQILRDVGKLREMAAESRTETALTSPKKGTRCVGGGASVVVSAGTDSMGRSTVRTQERRKDGDTDKTSTGGVDGNDMYRNGGVDGNDMYRNGGVDGIDMNSNGGVYGDEETRAMAPEHTHTGARTGYGEDRDSPSRTTDYGSARADGGLFAGASTGEVGGDRKRSRGVGASMLVSNLQEFRTRTRAGGLGPVDPAQLSPEYYLGGAKETQAALAPFIRGMLLCIHTAAMS